MDVKGQVLLPGNATASRLSDVLTKPAAVTLAAGDVITPDPDLSPPPEVQSLRVMDADEASALIRLEDQRRYVPKVDMGAADKMRVRHHAIARLLASGMKPAEISRTMDVTPPTIAMLERSPAFQALLMEYMNMMDQSAIDLRSRLEIMTGLGIDAITSKLVNAPDSIKPETLLEIVKTGADRAGAPVERNLNVRGGLTFADLRAIKDAPSTIPAQEGTWEDLGCEEGDGAGSGQEQSVGDEGAEGRDSVRAEDGADADGERTDRLVSDLAEVLGRGRNGPSVS